MLHLEPISKVDLLSGPLGVFGLGLTSTLDNISTTSSAWSMLKCLGVAPITNVSLKLTFAPDNQTLQVE